MASSIVVPSGDHTAPPKAGLKPGDQITRVKGRGVDNIAEVQRRIGEVNRGESVKLTVQRGKETKEITVKIGEGL